MYQIYPGYVLLGLIVVYGVCIYNMYDAFFRCEKPRPAKDKLSEKGSRAGSREGSRRGSRSGSREAIDVEDGDEPERERPGTRRPDRPEQKRRQRRRRWR